MHSTVKTYLKPTSKSIDGVQDWEHADAYSSTKGLDWLKALQVSLPNLKRFDERPATLVSKKSVFLISLLIASSTMCPNSMADVDGENLSINCEVSHPLEIASSEKINVTTKYKIQLSKSRIDSFYRSLGEESAEVPDRYPARLCAIDFAPTETYPGTLDSVRQRDGSYVIRDKSNSKKIILKLKKIGESRFSLLPIPLKIISFDTHPVDNISACQVERLVYSAGGRGPAIPFNHEFPVVFDFQKNTCEVLENPEAVRSKK